VNLSGILEVYFLLNCVFVIQHLIICQIFGTFCFEKCWFFYKACEC